MTPPRLRALTALWDRSTKKEIAVLASGSSLVVSFLAVVAAKTVGRTWRRFRRKRNKGQQQQQQQHTTTAPSESASQAAPEGEEEEVIINDDAPPPAAEASSKNNNDEILLQHDNDNDDAATREELLKMAHGLRKELVRIKKQTLHLASEYKAQIVAIHKLLHEEAKLRENLENKLHTMRQQRETLRQEASRLMSVSALRNKSVAECFTEKEEMKQMSEELSTNIDNLTRKLEVAEVRAKEAEARLAMAEEEAKRVTDEEFYDCPDSESLIDSLILGSRSG
ncbi:hypothetical protein PPROV_000552300 [Pycnococcus provasolii]|uniref:Uncharacterized protein n=1 Tax=Pycnococcus provasolii TaxID=41880 RepID=A0A830HNX8_9CHLO|nr:hypothetical protein PPROV_000552300 [Pycnococcus provasolii]